MQNWQAGYSFPAQEYQYTDRYTTYPSQYYASVNYKVQTPCYKYELENSWGSYEADFYPAHQNSVEHVKNVLEELDELKDEVRRYKEAEAAHLVELVQEL